MKRSVYYATMFLASIVLASCGGSSEKEAKQGSAPAKSMLKEEHDPMTNKGIGPVTELELGKIDKELAEAGKALFLQKCMACHKTHDDFIGPAPAGILDRRTPEWVMNMILNPEEMNEKDPIAIKLLEKYGAPMVGQGITEEEARMLLEYMRTL